MICYILGEYPSVTETFISQEISYISIKEPLLIISLRNISLMKYSEKYNCLCNNTLYAPSWRSFKVLRYLKVILCNSKRFILIYRDYCKKKSSSNDIRLYYRFLKSLLLSLYLEPYLHSMDIRHIHSHFANTPTDVAFILSQLMGLRFSFTAHSHDIFVDNINLDVKIEKAKFVVTCTKYNREYIKSLYPNCSIDNIHVLYHGIDFSRWNDCLLVNDNAQNYINNEMKILTIGRLVEKKGIIYLLKAINDLKTKGFIVSCIIVGEGKEHKNLSKYCKISGLEKNVSFLGFQSQDEIRKIFHNVSVFVLPSIICDNNDRDGIPNVLLEAMASGVPVISTNISAIPELVIDRFNGILVNEKDFTELSDAIQYMHLNTLERLRIIENAKITVKKNFCSSYYNEKLLTMLNDGK